MHRKNNEKKLKTKTKVVQKKGMGKQFVQSVLNEGESPRWDGCVIKVGF